MTTIPTIYTCKNGYTIITNVPLRFSELNQPTLYSTLEIVRRHRDHTIRNTFPPNRNANDPRLKTLLDDVSRNPLDIHDIYERIGVMCLANPHTAIEEALQLIVQVEYALDLDAFFERFYLQEIAHWVFHERFIATKTRFRDLYNKKLVHFTDSQTLYFNIRLKEHELCTHEIDQILQEYYHINDPTDYQLFLHWSPDLLLKHLQNNTLLRDVEIMHPKIRKYANFLTEQCHKYSNHPSISRLLAYLSQIDTVSVNDTYKIWM